jgi:hypothetical protein
MVKSKRWSRISLLSLAALAIGCSGETSADIEPRPGAWEGSTSAGGRQSFELNETLELASFEFDWAIPCDEPVPAVSLLGPITGAIAAGRLSFDRPEGEGQVLSGDPAEDNPSGIGFSVRGSFSSETEVSGTTLIEVIDAPFADCDAEITLSWTAEWVGESVDEGVR